MNNSNNPSTTATRHACNNVRQQRPVNSLWGGERGRTVAENYSKYSLLQVAYAICRKKGHTSLYSYSSRHSMLTTKTYGNSSLLFNFTYFLFPSCA